MNYYDNLPLIRKIKDDYKNWKPNDNILIGASMGSGKTSMILNVLTEYAKETNKTILYISNRKSLQNEIDETIKKNKLKSNTIISITYQKLQSILLNRGKNKEQNVIDLEIFNNVDYLVCDECHYFLTDSWTKTTDMSYEYILNHQKAVKIYMSATHYNIFEVLKMDLKNKSIIEYYIEYDFSYINKIVFYYEQEYIEYLIDNLQSTQKLIYFSRKLNVAFDLHNKYKNKSSFICSKSNKKYKKFITEKALSNGKLTNQLTFTSTTWDNGINILDSDVKHVIIDIEDLVTFIQCLGRRRKLKNDSGFTLHIRNWSKQNLSRFINPNRNQKKLNDLYLNDKQSYLQQLKAGDIKKGECLYNDINTKALTLNKLMDKNIRVQINRYYKIIDIGWDIYINKILKCKNVEHVKLGEIKLKNQISELEEYLNSIVGQKLFNEQQQELSNRIIQEISGIKEKRRINGKKLNPSTLEKILREDLDLEYAVSKTLQETIGDNKKRRYIIISKIN